MLKPAVLILLMIWASFSACKVRDSDASESAALDYDEMKQSKEFILLSGVKTGSIKLRCGRLKTTDRQEDTKDYIFGYAVDSQHQQFSALTTSQGWLGKIKRKVLEVKLQESEPGNKLTPTQLTLALSKVCDSKERKMYAYADINQEVRSIYAEWTFIQIMEQMMGIIIDSGEKLPLEYADYFE